MFRWPLVTSTATADSNLLRLLSSRRPPLLTANPPKVPGFSPVLSTGVAHRKKTAEHFADFATSKDGILYDASNAALQDLIAESVDCGLEFYVKLLDYDETSIIEIPTKYSGNIFLNYPTIEFVDLKKCLKKLKYQPNLKAATDILVQAIT
ncbi:hypothetical protein K0M31_005708 [Melipona bicolor]|uniref:Uncharacterized protein n=1 Tax=Melipona bicolor TaxID=60889 RepID=A0AA40KLX9_9HYME|nr:hypothetical protein K0M31_005708 [Melipona bicolor]